MGEGVVGREGWGREWWTVRDGRMLTVEKTKRRRRRQCHRCCASLVSLRTRSGSPVESFVALGAWVYVSLLSVAPVTLSFVGAGRSTAIVGGLRGCWAVGVVRWVLAVVCCLLSALCVVVNWAVVVCWAARFVFGGGCVTWQRATWRVHSVLLTLGTWACGCRVWLPGGCCGLWVARDVCGGGCCMWVTWWQAVVEVVVEKEGMSLFVTRVTFGSTLECARAITSASRSCSNL